MSNRFSRKAGDWEVAPLVQIGGAVKVGAGGWAFSFRSPSLKIKEQFYLAAAGIGLGGSLGGGSLTPDSYAELYCLREFSLADLHLSVGRIGSVGAGLSVGAGAITITAYPLTNPSCFFEENIIPGFTVGVGAAVLYFVGVWVCPTLKPANKEAAVEAFRHAHA